MSVFKTKPLFGCCCFLLLLILFCFVLFFILLPCTLDECAVYVMEDYVIVLSVLV